MSDPLPFFISKDQVPELDHANVEIQDGCILIGPCPGLPIVTTLSSFINFLPYGYSIILNNFL
jgi:hypothetical protein